MMVGFFEAHPAYLRLHLRDGITWAHPELARGLDVETWNAAVGMLAAAFEEGRSNGTLVDDDPHASARLLLAIIQSCLTDWILAKPRPEAATVIARLQGIVRRTFVPA